MKTAIKFLTTMVTLALLASTASAAVSAWSPIYEGVEYATGSKTSPRLMRAYALRIDLQNPNVGFYATPSNGGSPYETNLQTTPAFRSAYGLEAAINANFFSPSGSYSDVQGLLISNGTTVSLDQAYRQAQLRITADKVASIVGNGGNPGGIHTAVAGDAYHLTNGGAFGDNSSLAPRTSVGVSEDGKYLIMCVVDGRQSGYSDGATILDMSYWMLDFGAWNAMNLDGGGSSCICTASGGVLNSPSDGAPRSVGANLGVNSTSFNANGPSSVSWSPDCIDIVARGAGNAIMHKYWTADGDWSAWGNLGGVTYDSPAICSWGADRLDVFCIASDDTMRHKYWNGSSWSGSWTSLAGTLTSAPSAVSWGPDRIDVVARGGGNKIYHKSWNGTAWSGSWNDLGGNCSSAPAICSYESGRLDLFARDQNNNLVHKWYTGGNWSAWEGLGGTLTSAPAAVGGYWGGVRRIDVVVRGGSNRIYHKYYDGTSWHGFYDLGGYSASAPSINSRGDGRLDVFYRGFDGNLYQKFYVNGTGWSPWVNKGSYY